MMDSNEKESNEPTFQAECHDQFGSDDEDDIMHGIRDQILNLTAGKR